MKSAPPLACLRVCFTAIGNSLQVAGYAGLLLSTPTILYEIIAYIVPGLTVSEKRLLAPVMFGSSFLFFCGCALPAYAALSRICLLS